MSRGVFVTGTDTNVGKTIVCAALAIRYRPSLPVCYWKPVQTGIEHDDDTAEVRRLAVCDAGELLDCGIRLPRPVSPHLAARWAARTITIQDLMTLHRSKDGEQRWIVEGAGGALVPLNTTELMTDLMVALGFSIVVTARSGLGTINHTLLTLEALRARSLAVAGVVMVGDKNAENRAAIESYGGVAVLGEMPILRPLESNALAEWAVQELDPEGRLLRFLQ